MNFAHPHFEEPRWLLLAVTTPILLILLQLYATNRRRNQLAKVASPRFVETLTHSYSPVRRTIKNALLVIATAYIGIALARPQWGLLETKNEWLGEDMVFALDCSNSMLATDIAPNRLQRAKFAIMDFVRRHGRGRVGLVAFAGGAFLQCPLTLDYDAFEQALTAVNEKTIPVLGTDVGRALTESYQAMEKGSRRKLVVLVTDGEDLENSGVKTAEQLATNNVVVFTVGVGTPTGSEIHVIGQSGQPELLRDAKGEAVLSRLDQTTLQAIAKTTGGSYYPLGARGEGLAKVRTAVETLGSDDGRTRIQARGVERFHAPVAAVVVLLVVESLIGTRRRRLSSAEI